MDWTWTLSTGDIQVNLTGYLPKSYTLVGYCYQFFFNWTWTWIWIELDIKSRCGSRLDISCNAQEKCPCEVEKKSIYTLRLKIWCNIAWIFNTIYYLILWNIMFCWWFRFLKVINTVFLLLFQSPNSDAHVRVRCKICGEILEGRSRFSQHVIAMHSTLLKKTNITESKQQQQTTTVR